MTRLRTLAVDLELHAHELGRMSFATVRAIDERNDVRRELLELARRLRELDASDDTEVA